MSLLHIVLMDSHRPGRMRSHVQVSQSASQEAVAQLHERRASLLEEQLPAASAADQPCIVAVNIWPFDTANPSKPLTTPRLTLPRAVLCSEMGAHFSRCGRYLAVCVATEEPSPACLAWLRRQGRPPHQQPCGNTCGGDSAGGSSCCGSANAGGEQDTGAGAEGSQPAGGPVEHGSGGHLASAMPSPLFQGRGPAGGPSVFHAPGAHHAAFAYTNSRPGSMNSNGMLQSLAGVASPLLGNSQSVAMDELLFAMDLETPREGPSTAGGADYPTSPSGMRGMPRVPSVGLNLAGAAGSASASNTPGIQGFAAALRNLPARWQMPGVPPESLGLGPGAGAHGHMGHAGGAAGGPGQGAQTSTAAGHGAADAHGAGMQPLGQGSAASAGAGGSVAAAGAGAGGTAQRPPLYELRVYSLDGPTFGQVLQARPLQVRSAGSRGCTGDGDGRAWTV